MVQLHTEEVLKQFFFIAENNIVFILVSKCPEILPQKKIYVYIIDFLELT